MKYYRLLLLLVCCAFGVLELKAQEPVVDETTDETVDETTEETVDQVAETLKLGLPVVVIETKGEKEPTATAAYAPWDTDHTGSHSIIASKEYGRLYFLSAEGDTIYDSKPYVKKSSGTSIKLRGNSSGTEPKKSYKLKFEEKADLFGRKPDSIYQDKNWVLIRLLTYGNTLRPMNPLVGLKVNELMGMQWTPGCIYVNLVLNNTYRGIYALMENVKRNKTARIDVKDSGYIMEYDPYWWNEDEEFCFPTTISETINFHNPDTGKDTLYSRYEYSFKYPEDSINDDQRSYIQQWMIDFENCQTSGDYTKYISVNSWARWMLAHDILGSYDALGSNIFFTKKDSTDDTRVKMGNLWDFDGIEYKTEGKWANIHNDNRSYFAKFFNQDSTGVFIRAYQKIYAEESDSVFASIQNYLDSIESSPLFAAMNNSIVEEYNMWEKVDSVAKYPIVKMADEIALHRNWFKKRKVWLDKEIPLLTSNSKFILNITDAEWATVCVPFAFEIPQELEFYSIVAAGNDGALTMRLVTNPKANHPYVVHGPKGQYTLFGTNESTDDELENGLLFGTYEDIYVPANSYVLQNHNGVVGFYRVETDETISLSSNCAYLTPAMATMSRYRLVEDITGVGRVFAEEGPAYLNTMGISVDKATSGIYLKRMADGSYQKIVVRDR